MTDRTPIDTTNLDIYGNAALPWSRPRDVLDAVDPGAMVTWFLGTVRPDGRPHAAGVGAIWFDGDVYFVSGPGTQKSKNLAANPACTLSVSLDGIDLVFEGEAKRITDPATLKSVVGRYNEGGWPAAVEGDAFSGPFSAPSAGPPPWHLYRLEFAAVFGVAGEAPHGATRWRFAR
jgi:hypothetical protein